MVEPSAQYLDPSDDRNGNDLASIIRVTDPLGYPFMFAKSQGKDVGVQDEHLDHPPTV